MIITISPAATTTVTATIMIITILLKITSFNCLSQNVFFNLFLRLPLLSVFFDFLFLLLFFVVITIIFPFILVINFVVIFTSMIFTLNIFHVAMASLLDHLCFLCRGP